MKKLLFTSVLACLMLALSSLSASAQSPVNWSAKAKMTSATEGVVTLTATIDPGWHVYGTKMPEDGPAATKLYYGGKGIKFTSNVKASPTPKTENDPQFGTVLTFWDNKVTFTRKFTVTDASKAEVTVKVDYMCCNDQSCRPPKQETFVVKVEK